MTSFAKRLAKGMLLAAGLVTVASAAQAGDYGYKSRDYGYKSGSYGHTSPTYTYKVGDYGSYGSYGAYGSYGRHGDYLRYDNTGRYVGYHGASPDHYPVYSDKFKYGDVYYDRWGRYLGYDRDVYGDKYGHYGHKYGYRGPEAYGYGRWSEIERSQFKIGKLLGEIHHVKDQCPRQTIDHATAEEGATSASLDLKSPTSAFHAGYKRGMELGWKTISESGKHKFCVSAWKQFGPEGSVWAGLLTRPLPDK